MRSDAKRYQELREYIDAIPVIETHEHYSGIVSPVADALGFIVRRNYYYSDLENVAYGADRDALSVIMDARLPIEERLRTFERMREKTKQTAYYKAVELGLKACWGIDEITVNSLRDLQQKFSGRDQSFYDRIMDAYGIRAKVVNTMDPEEIRAFVDGRSSAYSKYCRFAFRLPLYHDIHAKADIVRLEEYLRRKVVCLDDYLESFENYLKKAIDFGVVCLKDQTAYRRPIRYANPSRGEAEAVFNRMINNPRDVFGDGQGARVLDDWLFHHFMRLARKYDLPVQVHTGHMSRAWNDITKANAAHLTSVMELHQDVRFALFHGNWPYMDEYLFLGKNYPNVWLDLCWVQSIDPIYSVELMKRAVMTVPQSKLMAFGGDTIEIEWTIGYLIQARDNVACALSELIESGWLNMREAREIAADWFFNNPNEFFKLGFAPFKP